MEPLCILRGHHQHLPVTTPSGFGRVLGVVGGWGGTLVGVGVIWVVWQ